MDLNNNEALCLSHHKAESGLVEQGYSFNDDLSTGTFNEIIIDGVRIFFNEMSTDKTRIIDAEFTSPFIEMLFLLEGGANETYAGHFCRITRNQHNLFFRTFFNGKYQIEGKNFQNFGIQLSEKFFQRLLDENAKSSNDIFEGIEKKQEYIRLSKQNLPITPPMRAVVYDILKNNRTGYMKRLFLESKIIELFMLQIEQAEIANNGKLTKFKKEDIDKIHEAKSDSPLVKCCRREAAKKLKVL